MVNPGIVEGLVVQRNALVVVRFIKQAVTTFRLAKICYLADYLADRLLVGVRIVSSIRLITRLLRLLAHLVLGCGTVEPRCE